MNPISSKVSNGAAAGSASGSIAVIFVWWLGHYMTIPPEIAAAMTTVVVSGVGFLGGWLTRLDPALLAPVTTTVTKTEEAQPAGFGGPAQPATTHTTTTTVPTSPAGEASGPR